MFQIGQQEHTQKSKLLVICLLFILILILNLNNDEIDGSYFNYAPAMFMLLLHCNISLHSVLSVVLGYTLGIL